MTDSFFMHILSYLPLFPSFPLPHICTYLPTPGALDMHHTTIFSLSCPPNICLTFLPHPHIHVSFFHHTYNLFFLVVPSPNSSHGYCLKNINCQCYTTLRGDPEWIGPDCSLRACPHDTAWVGHVVGANDLHPRMECSNKGTVVPIVFYELDNYPLI